MKNGKSTGNDGSTKKFYACLFCEVASTLVESLNHSFSVGELSTPQKQGVITSIKKKGSDKRLVKNWRFISLMNVDTKIASKVLALRMKKVTLNQSIRVFKGKEREEKEYSEGLRLSFVRY